ncbi:MAG: pimeloyl-ACP methyl ester esterase BioH [Gammaproteobacteria bacterium]
MPSKLHTETTGRGPDLFLVHGWALHGGIWNGVAQILAQTYRVTCVDLPGHGLSRESPAPATLSGLAKQLLDAAPENAIWLGWSLGGLACLRAALDFPGRVRALLLTNSTPRFVSAHDWPHAMPPAQLKEFIVELHDDYRKTIQRFLALQVRGDESARGVLRQLRASVFARGEPSVLALERGLEWLRDSDLRAELHGIRIPTLVMSGQYDRLTPPEAGAFLAAGIDGAKLVALPRAAHVPFLSHPAEFTATLIQFLRKAAGFTHA